MAPAGSDNKLEDRYARHRGIEWWDQQRLTDARVLVAGAGAIGNEVVKLLALMGVGHVTIVDFDRIEVTNLTRSVLFRDADIGQSKAVVAAKRAQEINPDIFVTAIDGDLEFSVGLGLYRSMDVVLGCLDSINARLALNRLCSLAGIPLLDGGIESTFGEVSLYAPTISLNTACFECGMTDSMWERRNRRYSCTGQQADIPSDAMPTTATIASVVAGYQVNEALNLLHADGIRDAGKQGLKPGQRMLVSLRPYDQRISDCTYNPDCGAHEKIESVICLNRSAFDATPLEVIEIADIKNGTMELGFDLLTSMTCVECGDTEEIILPIEKSSSDLTWCSRCNKETRSPDQLSSIAASSPYASSKLSELCIPNHQILAVCDAYQRRYVLLADP